jgi:dethiobiotin synthetase
MIRVGITGTDTGVGKTFVTRILLAMLRRQGLRVAAMKPVETGVKSDDPRSDAVQLRDAAGSGDPIEVVRPVRLAEPLAPWVALSRAGASVDLPALDAAFRRLSVGRDAVLVEGAGGLLVPLTRNLAYEGLFVGWSCGSAVHGALEYAKENLKEGDRMVIILPDHGTRYLGKVYNDEWMRNHGF